MGRLLATVVTLGLLSTFVFAIIVGAMLATGAVSLPIAIALVVLFNFAVLFIAPTLNDFIYRWLYGLEWIELERLRDKSPASAAVVESVTEEYDYPIPKLGYIDDRNPNAFTYGSTRSNARIVMTEGCFEFLDDDEVASVMAHELGHVTSRDFIIMTLANTLVQVLYLIAIHGWRLASTARSGPSRRGDPRQAMFVVAMLSYVLWFVGQYLVLYLSRVREYAADGFAAERTHPDALSDALVKIAYGIVMSEDSPELAKATRNIGIMDVQDSRDEGLIYHNTHDEDAPADLLAGSFMFDIKNPWARLMELRSTHPLTGKRIRALSARPEAMAYDFAEIERRLDIDTGRLYRNFFRDVGVLVLPMVLAVGFPLAYLGAVVLEVVTLSLFALIGGWLVTVGIAFLAKTLYQYPRGEAEPATVLEVLGDVYASPVRGRRVVFEGELIGRGQAGYRFSEDLMFRDRTGLMYLKYESWLPVLGNFLFALGRVPELIGESVRVDGWFLRGLSPWTGLYRLHTDDETIKGFIHLGGLVAGGVLILVGAIVLGVWVIL